MLIQLYYMYSIKNFADVKFYSIVTIIDDEVQ